MTIDDKIRDEKLQYDIKRFKDLRDGNVNPKEVLKDQIDFKANLNEIKKGNTDLKSKDQVSVIPNA